MKEKRLLLIINPIAGKCLVQSHLYEIVQPLAKAGFEVVVYPTQGRGDAALQVQKKGAQYDRIVCCGGDGTLNEVISGLLQLENRPELGHIPTGTTNDFAQSLGFPQNLSEAAAIAAKGVPYPCDIGRFETGCFTYIAAFGAFTDVPYATDQQVKNMFGGFAYFFEGMKHLGNLQGHDMEVKTENGTIRDEFLFGAVANSRSIAGFRALFSDAVALDDGQFEVLLIRRPQTLAALNKMIANLMTQQFDQQQVRFFKAKSLTFQSAVPVSWTLDGEAGGNYTKVNISCQNKAVTFIVAPEYLNGTEKTDSF